MDESAPRYATLIDEPVIASPKGGGLKRDQGERRVEFTVGDALRATLYPLGRRKVGGKSRATADFGDRAFHLDVPDDRTLGDVFREWWNPHDRRRVWRAGTGIAAEIRDETQRKLEPVGRFERGGIQYHVHYEITWWPLTAADTASIMADRLEAARIDADPDSKDDLLISIRRPLRLDVIVMAYHLYEWLVVRGGGTAGAGAGGGGDGGC